MASHGKLERPTVVEVILGFHFAPAHPLDQYIESLAEALQQRYAEREELVYENFTLQLPAKPETGRLVAPQISPRQVDPDLPRFKFSDDQGMAVQVGDGLLTINCTDYRGFDQFFEHAVAIISEHHRLARNPGYSRIGLRYINLFPLGDPTAVYSWALRPPVRGEQETDLAIRQLYQQVNVRLGDYGLQQIIAAAPQRFGDRVGMSLDIDHFVQFDSPVRQDVQSLHQWVNMAHDQVWVTFKSALTSTYFEELERDTSSDQ